MRQFLWNNENWCRMSCFLISHQMLINIQHKHLLSGVREELGVFIEALLITIPAFPPRPTLKKSSKMGGREKLIVGLPPWLTSFGIISSETAIQRVHVKFEQLNVKYDSNNRWELRYLNRDLI